MLVKVYYSWLATMEMMIAQGDTLNCEFALKRHKNVVSTSDSEEKPSPRVKVSTLRIGNHS